MRSCTSTSLSRFMYLQLDNICMYLSWRYPCILMYIKSFLYMYIPRSIHTYAHTYIHLMFMLDFRIGPKLSNFVDTPNNKKNIPRYQRKLRLQQRPLSLIAALFHLLWYRRKDKYNLRSLFHVLSLMKAHQIFLSVLWINTVVARALILCLGIISRIVYVLHNYTYIYYI